MNRDCNICIWHTSGSCSAWECEYISRDEALEALEKVKKMPSNFVYCKDCEWWEKQKDSPQGRCELMQMYPTGGWFCGNGKKRVEG